MKNIKLAILALFTLMVSCEDAIEIDQPGILDPETTFQNVDDMQRWLNFVYGQMSNNSQIALSSIWTDEVGIGYANGGQGLTNEAEYSFNLTTGSSFASGMWERNYDIINFANRLEEGATFVTPTDDELDQYNDILAQNRAIRAWANFELLTYFSENLKDDSALGVIKVDHVPSVTEQLPRATNGEMFDFIESDLTFAAEHLNSRPNGTFINENFVTALRARMALYRGQYGPAETYAQQLIDQVPLSNRSTYQNIWTDTELGEVIFKLERTTGNALVGANWFSIDHTLSGSPFYEVGRSLFNALDTNDIRYDVIVGPESVIDPNYMTSTDYRNSDKLLINKYPGSESTVRLNDLKIFRVAEMYFIKAEAQIDANNFSGAAQTLNELEVARYATGTAPAVANFGSKQEALQAVLKQRRLEYAFEGYRYVDIKRLGEEAGVDIVRDPRDCEVNDACSLSASSYKLTLPIPAVEISANDAIAGQQNSGY